MKNNQKPGEKIHYLKVAWFTASRFNPDGSTAKDYHPGVRCVAEFDRTLENTAFGYAVPEAEMEQIIRDRSRLLKAIEKAMQMLEEILNE